MTDKLAVTVSLDVDGRTVTVNVQGHVTDQNVEALYSVVHRANSLGHGPEIVVDVSGAAVERHVLDGLQAYASLRRLPHYIDPEQHACHLRLVSGDGRTPTEADVVRGTAPQAASVTGR